MTPYPKSKGLAAIVDMGSDFPPSIRETLEALKCSIVFRETPGRKTTRGQNIYGPGELRGETAVLYYIDLCCGKGFEYVSPKKRLDVDDLSPALLASKTFHLICNPTRAISLVKNILSRRKENKIEEMPLFLWEPVPGVCTSNNWKDCMKAMKYVGVITPNINEAAEFLGQTIDEELPFEQFKGHVEKIAEEYGSHQSGMGKAIVIRCGKHGCLLHSSSVTKWVPAYHQTREKVIDPTGGGNTFCGGFCAGWVQSEGDFETGCVFGNIAASYVIERFGLPELTFANEELWNGDSIEVRRGRYRFICQEGRNILQ